MLLLSIIFIAGVLNLFLGVYVWSRDRTDSLHRTYGAFGIVSALWVFSVFIFRYLPNIVALRGTYAMGVFVAAISLIWVLKICGVRLKNFVRFFIYLIAVILSVLSLSTDWVIASLKEMKIAGYEGGTGPLFPLIAIYFAITLTCILYVLLITYRSVSGVKKQQLLYVIIGASIFIFSAFTVSFFLPLFDIIQFTSLDAPSSLFFIVFTFYAILKHHLFNIKVIATEVFTVLIVLILLIDVTLAESWIEFILKFCLFAATVIFSILLIRNMLNQIRARNKITKMTRVLKHTNLELRRIDRAKSDFVSIASHQLRTPLSIIKGFLSMISEGFYGPLPEKAQDKLGKSLESNERLIKLVDDLLDLSHMEGGKMKFNFKVISLRAIVENVVKSLRSQAENKGLDLIYRQPRKEKIIIKADSVKIHQVVHNLINNAIRYTEKGSVEVKLKRTGSKILFSVKDTGAGVSEEEQKQLFKKFIRGKRISRLWAEGRGLGLYVAKLIIEAHQGKMSVESEGEGKGSEFWVRLPVAKEKKT